MDIRCFRFLIGLQTRREAAVLQSWKFTRDSFGNLRKREQLDADAVVETVLRGETFTYDLLDRLTTGVSYRAEGLAGRQRTSLGFASHPLFARTAAPAGAPDVSWGARSGGSVAPPALGHHRLNSTVPPARSSTKALCARRGGRRQSGHPLCCQWHSDKGFFDIDIDIDIEKS